MKEFSIEEKVESKYKKKELSEIEMDIEKCNKKE